MPHTMYGASENYFVNKLRGNVYFCEDFFLNKKNGGEINFVLKNVIYLDFLYSR